MFNNRILKQVFILLVFLIFYLPVTRGMATDSLRRFSFEHTSMGTLFRIVCYGSDSIHALQTAERAFLELDTLNQVLSDYLPFSELMRLCQTAGEGRFVPVSEDLFQVIRKSQYWSGLSSGDFDITIGSLTKLWRRAGRKEKFPAPDDLQEALRRVDYRLIHLDTANREIMIEKEDVLIDLGGIAKGFAVDRLFNIMENAGYLHVLVDGGGDIRAGSSPPEKSGWKVIMPGWEQDTAFFLTDQAVATSGDLYRFVEIDGSRYSHIIDPSTGYGITTPRTVTVFAEDCTTADVLASILSIKGFPEGFLFLEDIENANAAIIREKIHGEIQSYTYSKDIDHQEW